MDDTIIISGYGIELEKTFLKIFSKLQENDKFVLQTKDINQFINDKTDEFLEKNYYNTYEILKLFNNLSSDINIGDNFKLLFREDAIDNTLLYVENQSIFQKTKVTLTTDEFKKLLADILESLFGQVFKRNNRYRVRDYIDEIIKDTNLDITRAIVFN